MIELLSEKDFDSVYTLMQKSFPDDEYRVYSEQKALLEDPSYRIYGVKAQNGELQSIAAVWDVGDRAFVEHLAVDPAFRNQGMGATVLRELVRVLGKQLFLEVEPPEDELQKRRIGFYLRNGFFLNFYQYTQPALSRGRRPVPLLIMTYGREISEQEFMEIQRILYTDVYKCL